MENLLVFTRKNSRKIWSLRRIKIDHNIKGSDSERKKKTSEQPDREHENGNCLWWRAAIAHCAY